MDSASWYPRRNTNFLFHYGGANDHTKYKVVDTWLYYDLRLRDCEGYAPEMYWRNLCGSSDGMGHQMQVLDYPARCGETFFL